MSIVPAPKQGSAGRSLNLDSLNKIAESLNRMILAGTRGGKYLTMFLGLIDLRCKTIDYINCGHVPPVVVRDDGDPVGLTEGGMVVGLFDNVRYNCGQVKFRTGDVLVLCTDGITEAMDAKQEEYGSERLVKCVRSAITQSAVEILSTVQQGLRPPRVFNRQFTICYSLSCNYPSF